MKRALFALLLAGCAGAYGTTPPPRAVPITSAMRYHAIYVRSGVAKLVVDGRRVISMQLVPSTCHLYIHHDGVASGCSMRSPVTGHVSRGIVRLFTGSHRAGCLAADARYSGPIYAGVVIDVVAYYATGRC